MRRRRIFSGILSLGILGKLFFTPTLVDAAIVTITEEGDTVWNVLSSESDSMGSIKIVNLPEGVQRLSNAYVSLGTVDGRLQVQVKSERGQKSADVTELREDIIEIEQEQDSKRMKIATEEDKFLMIQKDITAQTVYPITISSAEKKLFVETPSGLRYIQMFPQDVVENIVRADIVDQINNSTIELTEGSAGELEYKISGEKLLTLFNVVQLTAPLKLSVSATNGELLHIDKPTWYKLFGFIFS